MHVHRMEFGQRLSDVARQYGTTTEAIVAANPHKESSFVFGVGAVFSEIGNGEPIHVPVGVGASPLQQLRAPSGGGTCCAQQCYECGSNPNGTAKICCESFCYPCNRSKVHRPSANAKRIQGAIVLPDDTKWYENGRLVRTGSGVIGDQRPGQPRKHFSFARSDFNPCVFCESYPCGEKNDGSIIYCVECFNDPC